MTRKNQPNRQLAAIMFTDIVGYTSLMQTDERAAMRIREKHRTIFEETHKTHQGTIIQYYGDGTLSIFKSSLDAAACATQMQKAYQTDEPKVPLRIGLHVGDISYDETEVYGNGVNVTSRIESMGVAGSVLLSARLNEDLKNHKEFNTLSLGSFAFKNVSEPMEVFALTGENLQIPTHTEQNSKSDGMKSIAVLPFVNMSASDENAFFCDGMTEEIINALAKIDQLKVTSRTSSFYYKDRKVPLGEIAQQLKVSTILEGSVRLAGNQMRITAQLIQAENDFHFWSETWDRQLENIFEIQDEISLQIADKLREHFGHLVINEHLVTKQTDNLDAYTLFLKGRYHINKWNPEDVRTAMELYKQALDLDPRHANSLVGLAGCYSFLATTGFISYEEGWGKSAELTNKALAINDQLPAAYYELANLAFFTTADFRQAFTLIQKAISINPNHVESQQFMSFLYILAGKREEAKEHLQLALSIDPLSQETQFYSGYLDYMLGDFQNALAKLDACLEVNPRNIPAHSVKANCLSMLGRHDEVIRYFDSVPSDIVIRAEKIGTMTLGYAMKKDDAHTAKHLELLQGLVNEPDGFAANAFLFLYYGLTCQADKVFEWVENALEKRYPLLLLRFADPLMHSIKDDPRYLEFQQKLFPPDLFHGNETKEKKVLIEEKAAEQYKARVLSHIEDEVPYLNPDLSLRSLASQVDIPPNQLSWLLNESIGKNFNEFINHHRIEHFKKLATDPTNDHISLIGLAYESGFNSKTVFNTFFKKEVGMTPREYVRQHS